jgi:transposase
MLDALVAGTTDPEILAEQLRPFSAAVELLCRIPGVQRRTAEAVLAEFGIVMAAAASENGQIPLILIHGAWLSIPLVGEAH